MLALKLKHVSKSGHWCHAYWAEKFYMAPSLCVTNMIWILMPGIGQRTRHRCTVSYIYIYIYIQSSAIITRSNISWYWTRHCRNKVEYQWEAEPTKHTPYLVMTGEQWDVFCEYSGENWARYNGTALYICIYKNIERNTADSIVSWPNPKQWVIVHTSDLIMMITQSIYILSITTREMGKLKTYSPTYCIMDNKENMLNLTHTLDQIYLTSIL